MLRNSLANPPPGPPPDDLNPAPVVIPDNALTRQYDAISGRQATVSLPAARVVTSDHGTEPEFQFVDPLVNTLEAMERQGIRMQQAAPLSTQAPRGFQGIDLQDCQDVVGAWGERFAMTPEERQKALQFCFEVAQRATLAGLESLRQDLGLCNEKSPDSTSE